MIDTTRRFTPTISTLQTEAGVGASAAAAASRAILEAISERGRARILLASAPSQQSMLAALTADPHIDWALVDAFHLDDYVGIDPVDPHSFGAWLAARLPMATIGQLVRIDTLAPPQAAADRYAQALRRIGRFDLTCLGIGVNGHLAFNEPGDAALTDDRAVRIVALTPESRQQQVDDALFDDVQDVPEQALTVTIPVLLNTETVVATVLGERKADAVAAALEGPVDESCPASALQLHPASSVHLDLAAASHLGRLA